MSEKCPNCGYCPHCGRGGKWEMVPSWAPYQTQPYWVTGTDTNPNLTVGTVTAPLHVRDYTHDLINGVVPTVLS